MSQEIDQEAFFEYLRSYFESYSQGQSKTGPLIDKIRHLVFERTYVGSDGVCRKGVTTKQHAKELLEMLKHLLGKAEAATIQKMGADLFSKPKEEALSLVKTPLHQLKIKESLSIIGGDPLNDWERWLKMHCEILIDQQTDRVDVIDLQASESDLSQRQVALLYYYDGHKITQAKANQIAQDRGWSKKFWAKVQDVQNDGIRKSGRDFKKDLDAVIAHLKTDAGRVKAKLERSLLD